MRLGTVALLVVACLLAAACGGDDSESGRTGSAADGDTPANGFVEWADVAPTLRPGLDPTDANACVAGRRACLDAVVAEMERRAAPLRDGCDHNLMFAEMYLVTTLAIADELDAGRFVRPDTLVNFLAWFASFYFDARDAWVAGRVDEVVPAWQLAFAAADERDVRGFGNLMAGLAAHIGDDLANAVADVFGAAGEEVDVDFLEVNEVIVEISEGLVAELADRYDPELDVTMALLSVGGDVGFAVAVRTLRNEAWAAGTELAVAADGRPAREAELSRRIADRVDVVLDATAYLPFVESSGARDEFCLAGGR